jgi:hypothetical protein
LTSAWFDRGLEAETWNSEASGEAMVVHGHLDLSITEMRARAENDEQSSLY